VVTAGSTTTTTTPTSIERSCGLRRRSGRLAWMTDEPVGRDEELAAVRGARLRRRPGVIVAAPPGTGRTTVVSAVVDELRARRADVLFVRATASARQLRYAALSPLLRDAVDGPLDFDVVAGALDARARSGSFVLAIDDLHLLDEASQRVIAHSFAREPDGDGERAGTPPFLVATIDDTFLGLDPVTATLAPSTRPDRVPPLELLRLAPLSRDDVATLVARRVEGPVDAGAWWERCGGNPTALLAALDALVARTPDLDGGDVARLGAAARSLLDVIVLAEPFPLDAAFAAAGGAALDELGEAGLVLISDEGSGPAVRLRHPGMAPRLRRTIGPLRARGARRAALAVLRDRWHALDPSGRLRLAALAVESGVELRPEELAEAAALAPRSGDAKLTLRLVREAARCLGRFEDLARLADVAHEQGHVADLEAVLEQMSAEARTPAERTATAVASAQHLLWRRRDVAGALAALEHPDAAGQGEVAALRSRVLATTGDAAAAIELAAPLAADASPRVRSQAAIATAHALRRLGRPAAAVAVLDEVLRGAGAAGDPVLSVSRQVLAVARVHALTEAGRWSDAADDAARALSYAERYDEAAGRAIALLVHGVERLESGSPGPAAASLGEALELFESVAQPAGRRWALAGRALAHGLGGDPVGARNDLDAHDAIGDHPADLFPQLVPRARAWALVAAAEPEAARAVLREAVDDLLARGAPGPAWSCAHDLLSLDHPGTLLGLAPVAGEPICELRIAHARAVQARDADDLELLAERYERLGGLRWAAECAAAAAHAAARSGAKEVARRAHERLEALTARCAGLDIPAVSAGRTLSLTVREREIALLAARGLTSRAIGDRLGLSVRTVDNHLARCYDKLGTRSRAELADLLAG